MREKDVGLVPKHQTQVSAEHGKRQVQMRTIQSLCLCVGLLFKSGSQNE